jgi:hypothetical protein
MVGKVSAFAALLLLASLSLLTGCGSSHAQLRALQASPDETTTLDLLLDGKTVFSDLALGSPTSYGSVSSGSRHLQVEPTGSTTTVIDQTISLDGGQNYTLITANNAISLTPILLTDDKTAPDSGNVKIRVVNAGAGAGSVDVYITTPGNLPGVVPPAITSLPFSSASSYQMETAASYEIFFTVAGTTFQYIDTGSQSFAAGQNRTFVMVPSVFGGYTFVELADLN